MKIMLNNKILISSNYDAPDRLFVISDSRIGSIDEFLQTLHVGDSAIMIAPADSMQKYAENIVFAPNDKVYVYLTVTQIISRQELSSEEKEVQRHQQAEEENLTEYILNNYEHAEKKESGLFFLSLKEGSGKKAEYGDRVYVNYTVKDTSGNIFDTNIEESAKESGIYNERKLYRPFDFVLGDDSLIAGWTEGISYMKTGGKAMLIIPSKLAYGELGFGKIPAYTPLVMEVSVIRTEKE